MQGEVLINGPKKALINRRSFAETNEGLRYFLKQFYISLP
jgi:hypothetical protein